MELKRCVFSLVCSTYRPLNIIIVTQRFTESDINAVHAAIEPMFGIEGAPSLNFVNWQSPRPLDGRSALINEGMKHAKGRYLAFLDYDDVIYPSGYKLLIEQLGSGNCGIAFASVRILSANVHKGFIEATAVRKPFPGKALEDLFMANFCPIHSYVLDRKAVPDSTLSFDESLNWEEDYEFLLRICASVRSNFSMVGVCVGDYYMKKDGSNTVPIGHALEERRTDYSFVCDTIMARKRFIRLSSEVLSMLGVEQGDGNITIADLCA